MGRCEEAVTNGGAAAGGLLSPEREAELDRGLPGLAVPLLALREGIGRVADQIGQAGEQVGARRKGGALEYIEQVEHAVALDEATHVGRVRHDG